MDIHRTALRLGAVAIVGALLFRLAGTQGLPGEIVAWINRPQTAAFLIYLETGRDVRFLASSQVFSPEFAPESSDPLRIDTPVEKLVFSASDAEAVSVYYAGNLRPDLGSLIAAPLDWDLTAPEPTVLILHTHATESYTQNGEPYEESSAWRTLDENYNMLSVGDALGRLLAQKGITAVHDRTLHDYPSYNGSYSDARKSIAAYLEAYPSVRLVLDLHRDAADTETGQLRTVVNTEGGQIAQLMLVMGTDEAGLTHPNWEENLSLALKLHALLEQQCPGIMRPLILRSQRFNQDMSSGALLVEVGAAGNSHEEALGAVEQLAEAIAALARGSQ